MQVRSAHAVAGAISANLSTPSTNLDHLDDSDGSLSSFEEIETTGRTIDEYVSILKAIEQGNYSDEEGIQALPRRRSKIQRQLAIKIAQAFYPKLTEIAAIIQYQRVTTHAKAVVRDEQRARIAAKNQGELLKIQGPWKGQELDPVDLKGPTAIPMPVEIGKVEDFAPIFNFLAQDESFAGARGENSHPSLEFSAKTEQYTGNVPLLEFPRGLIYEDGRLDLCKKVVGPTHIGNLMKSLESNHHIRHFLLGNNAISATGAKHISEFIQKHPDRMETWYLAGCHLTRYGLSLLVPQMVKSSTINNLWFKRNPLGANSSNLLAELVLKTSNLRTLDLETTELGDEGIHQFIDSIAGHSTSLRNIYLNANGMGERASASLGRYLADPHCALESLFISTNPIGDAGMLHIADGLSKNTSLKRLMCASAGLTGKGLTYLASALGRGGKSLQTLDVGASATTKAHAQKFNYYDDSSVEALKSIIKLPSLRWLNVGRTVLSEEAFEDIRSVVLQSELVFLDMHRVYITSHEATDSGKTELYDAAAAPKSFSLEIRKHLAQNQAKYFPEYTEYDEFLRSDANRFLRNTPDVRQIDSMYRTQDKRLGLPMDLPWAENDPVWKLINEDAKIAEAEASGR